MQERHNQCQDIPLGYHSLHFRVSPWWIMISCGWLGVTHQDSVNHDMTKTKGESADGVIGSKKKIKNKTWYLVHYIPVMKIFFAAIPWHFVGCKTKTWFLNLYNYCITRVKNCLFTWLVLFGLWQVYLLQYIADREKISKIDPGSFNLRMLTSSCQWLGEGR